VIGYSVSFFPGSSGRFLANILYSILNDIEYEFVFDEVNSSHSNILYKSNIDFSKIPQVDYTAKSNYIQLFRHLHFLPSEYVPVFPTHAFPVTEDLDLNNHVDTFNMVIVGLTENDLIEVNTNHIIKNIWPLIQKLKEVGFEGLSEIDTAYLNDTIKSLADYKINLLKLDRPEVLEQYARLASIQQLKTSYIRFIYPNISSKYIDKTLLIQYNDLFVKTDTGYMALDLISEYIGKRPNDSILNAYDKYVSGRQSLLDRFNFIKRV